MSEPVKVLSTKELGNVIDTVVRENVKLSDNTKILMSRVYDRFRHRISGSFNAHDLNDSLALIGDMMAMVNAFSVDGAEKKEIIMETIQIVIRFEVPADKRDACTQLLNTVLSPAIDLAIYFKKQLPQKIRFCPCM